MEIGDLDRSERRLTRDRRQPSRIVGTGGYAYGYRPGRAPTLAILHRDFAFVSSVARLGELAGLSVSIFWTVEELLAAPTWHCDALIVDKASWLSLEAMSNKRLGSRLDDTATYVVGDAERVRGAQFVLDAALAQVGKSDGAWATQPAGAASRLAVVDAQGDFGKLVGIAARRRGVSLDYFVDLQHLARDVRLGTYAAVIIRCELGALLGGDFEAGIVGALGGAPALLVMERGTHGMRLESPDLRLFHDVSDIEGILAMTLTLAKRRRGHATIAVAPGPSLH